MRDQIFGIDCELSCLTEPCADIQTANAAALFPHLIKGYAAKTGQAASEVDPKNVFQVLLLYEDGWIAALVYGNPTIKSTLARTTPARNNFLSSKVPMPVAIESLLGATAQMLGVKRRAELHIPGHNQHKISKHGTFDTDFL